MSIYNDKNIGDWFNRQKWRMTNNDDRLYVKFKDNNIIKTHLDNHLKFLELYNKRPNLTFDDYCKLLFTYCDNNKYVPTHCDKQNNINIGMWFKRYKKNIKSKREISYITLSKNEYVKHNLVSHLSNKK
jgi:hypothetical protein